MVSRDDRPCPPNDTDIEKENGVTEVNIFGVIEVTKAENGWSASGIMQKMRRGTASHKTELSEERVDLMENEPRS